MKNEKKIFCVCKKNGVKKSFQKFYATKKIKNVITFLKYVYLE